MARNVFRLVIITLLSALVSIGCGPAETNQPIYIESDFNDAETMAILRAIETWNSIGRKYVRGKLIDYRGRYTDANGFNLENNVGDEYPVIYKVDDEQTMHFLTDHIPGDIAGIRFGDDIVLFPVVLSSDPTQQYLTAVESTALHELGHWLGLPDEWDPTHRESIMYWTRGRGEPLKLAPTKYDIDNICQIYDCIK